MNLALAALPTALLGFGIGWLSALLTERVTPPEDAAPIRYRSALLRDPLVQLPLALIWAAMPFIVGGEDVVRWIEGGLLAVPLVQVGVTDLRTRYVYTLVAGVGLLLGLAIGWHFHAVDWWWSPVAALGGALAFGALYGLGRLMYRGGEPPMARGDITIAAMVAAAAANQAAAALIYGVIASGLLAVGVLVAVRSRKVYMPYGPGLCLGGLITILVLR